MCSIGKTFFFTKIEYKQLRLNSLASFTNIGPDTYILLWKYCHTSVASHLMISSALRAVVRSIINKTREKTRKSRAVTSLFM